MDQQSLFAKFYQALTWNGILFATNRMSKIIVTLVVFANLSTLDFATWANVFSLVFIVRLWIDFGFSRSLPRYCPEFSHNTKIKNAQYLQVRKWETPWGKPKT